MIDLAKDYGSGAPKQEPPVSQTVAKQRMYSFLLAVTAAFYRDLMLCKNGSSSSDWIHADQQSLVKDAAQRISLLDASRAVRIISRAEYLILTNVNANLVLDDLFSDLAEFSSPPTRGRASLAKTR